MIFEAKCKSFKILVIVLGLVGTTLVADCRAERNPVSPVLSGQQSFFHEVVSDQVVAELEALKRDRVRNEKRWSELKSFVGKQATAAGDKFVGFGLSDWWQQRVSPNKKPVARQQPAGDVSIAISPVAMMVKLAGNMSALQWWQVSNQTTRLFAATEERVVQTSMKFQGDFQANLLQLARTSANHLGQKVNGLAAFGFAREIFAVGSEPSEPSEHLESKPVQATSNVNDAAADLYWSYYSDCDFWGVEFNQADED